MIHLNSVSQIFLTLSSQKLAITIVMKKNRDFFYVDTDLTNICFKIIYIFTSFNIHYIKGYKNVTTVIKDHPTETI